MRLAERRQSTRSYLHEEEEEEEEEEVRGYCSPEPHPPLMAMKVGFYGAITCSPTTASDAEAIYILGILSLLKLVQTLNH
ncbi:uncharacterized [Tachysurus ichikawai]